MAKNDGGPFHPTGIETFDGPNRMVEHFPGATLRDWFAGQIMAAHVLVNLERKPYGKELIKELAKVSYECADTMLAEKEK